MDVAVFVSGGGSNLQALFDAQDRGELSETRLALVVASRPSCYAIERAKKRKLPVAIVSKRDYSDQAAYDQALLRCLREHDLEADALIVLAGFLTRLGADFVQAYAGRILNIHPSLLPAFGGRGYYGIKVHEAVLDYGCKISGATVHLVDEEYDHGPIVLQQAVQVRAGEGPEQLQMRIMKEAEQKILPRAVDLFTRDKLIREGRIVRVIEAEPVWETKAET